MASKNVCKTEVVHTYPGHQKKTVGFFFLPYIKVVWTLNYFNFFICHVRKCGWTALKILPMF